MHFQILRHGGPIFAATLLAALLTGCGGGGGGSSPSPTVTPTRSNVAEDTDVIDWAPTYLVDIPDSLVLVYSLLDGSEAFTTNIFIASPTDTPATSPQEVIKSALFISSNPPVPAAAGTPYAYIQFQAEPGSITPSAGDTLEIGGANDITGVDPFGILPGTYIECSIYAGTQLIGSGSNIALNNGYTCSAANHGNSSSEKPYIPLPDIQGGTVYTVVYSRLSS